jgi:hypothetical protein
MTEQAPTLSRHDLEAKVVKRCWVDEGFGKEFTADPAGALVKYLQVPAASLPKVVVHQEAPGSWHIVLPAKPDKCDELSEEELEKMSGGTTPTTGLTLAGTVLASVVTASVIVLTASQTAKDGW